MEKEQKQKFDKILDSLRGGLTGEAFRKVRELLGYTREQIAHDIGVSWETVKAWEMRKPKSEVPRYAKMAVTRIILSRNP